MLALLFRLLIAKNSPKKHESCSFHSMIMFYFEFDYDKKIPITHFEVCGCNVSERGKVQGVGILFKVL